MWKPHQRYGVLLIMLGLTAGGWGQSERGTIQFEYWDNVTTTQLSDLYLDLRWPDVPDQREQRTLFEGLTRGDNYGTRIRGYVYPPQTGDYQFWIASDDDSMLWLSSDADPTQAAPIARVDGATGARVYDAQPSQQSAIFSLQADQPYYIEVIHREGTGGDHVSVAWTGPGIGDTPQVIDGAYLSPYIAPQDYLATAPKPEDGSMGAKNAILIWKPSAHAVSQEVYLGTEAVLGPDQKVADKSGTTTIAILTVALESDQTYFWRIDTVDGTGMTHTGQVWSFTAKPSVAHNPTPAHGAKWQAADRVVLQWKAGEKAALHRVYGSVDHSAVVGGEAAALLGESPATVALPGALEPGVTYYWRVDEVAADGSVQAGSVWDFKTWAPAGARGQYHATDLDEDPVLERIDPTIDFSWKDGSPAEGLPDDGYAVRWTADLAVPKTGEYVFQTLTDGGVRLWLDGRLLIDEFYDVTAGVVGRQRLALNTSEVYALTMKYYENSDNAEAHLSWEYWTEPGTILKQIIPEGPLHPPVYAGTPRPAQNDSGVDPGTPLTWSPGYLATAYDVYLDTDAAAVANATPDSAGIYQGQQSSTTLIPNLRSGTTYFWRVDTVNVGAAEKGTVWSFTTADYVIVENFETYGHTDEDNPIWLTWSDGFATGQSGSVAGYDYPPYVETFITQGGLQALPLRYDNTGNAGHAIGANYSEVSREFSSPVNLVAQGGTKLVLYFYGQSSNQLGEADSLYVGLEDTGGQRAWVTDSDTNTRCQRPVWQTLEIDLSAFAGVNVQQLKALYIGIGNRTAPAAGGQGTILIDSIAVLP
ncbi:PA14 domain-containing protein [Planctomycetota bacterium]